MRASAGADGVWLFVIHPFITATMGVRMIISRDDARQLRQRAQHRHDAAARPLTIDIMEACSSGVFRLVATRAQAHRHCPARACLRARRCAGQPLRCGEILRRLQPEHDAVELIDAMYWRVLQRLVDGDADTERGTA